MTKIRSFIAINLSEKIKKELISLLDELKKLNKEPSIKWVKPEGLHLTLHFLGYQKEVVLKEVGEAIERKIKELHLSQNIPKLFITEINAFPNLFRPKILFIACQEEGNRNLIKKLQKEIGRELENLNIEIDHRPWTPHLTLARLKIPQMLHVTGYMLQRLSFEVRSIELMKSELTPSGAKYSVLEKFSF